jgi:VWFA-related protein
MNSHVWLAIIKQWHVRLLAAFVLSYILLSSLSPIASSQLASSQQGVSTGGANRSGVPTSPEVYRSGTVILVHSDLVLIPVTVTDHSGKAVTGLEKQHFTLFEDSTQQDIIHFAAEDAPASIGIVLDTSGSMRPKIAKAREAVNALLSNSNPDDEFFLVRFSTEARLVAPMTQHPEDIRNQMGGLRTSGTTALLDAVRLAIAEMEHARNSRKAIVIVSDGEDNSSLWTVGELKRAVREHEIIIYSIGIPTAPGERSECPPAQPCGSALLKDISNQTGGRLFEVNRVEQLPAITATIGGWLRHQYVLGYVPSHSAKDGTYRKVDLKLDRPKGYPKLNAVWRHGYYAPKE